LTVANFLQILKFYTYIFRNLAQDDLQDEAIQNV
jgi:hypothetical protein